MLKAAEALGFQPNPIARGLKTNRSYTIGVLIPVATLASQANNAAGVLP